MKRIGVLIAVEAEAHAVLENRELGFRRTGGGIWSSSSYPFDLILSGVGKVLAAHALMSLENYGNCTWYWSLGTSGSLGTEPVGSMFLCTSFIEWDMDIRPLGFPLGITAYEKQNSPVFETMHGNLADMLYACTGFPRALVLSGDTFITDEQLVENLLNQFGTDLPVLVDMESAAIAKLCVLRIKKQYCALRWVTDNANKESGNSWNDNVKRASADFADVLCRVGRLALEQNLW